MKTLSKEWMGLPLYAWLAGGGALILGIVFFMRSGGTKTTKATTVGGSDAPAASAQYVPYPYPVGGNQPSPSPAPVPPPIVGGSGCPPGYIWGKNVGRCVKIISSGSGEAPPAPGLGAPNPPPGWTPGLPGTNQNPIHTASYDVGNSIGTPMRVLGG